MAVAKHLEYLNNGTAFWNNWRCDNPRIRPVLTGVDLSCRDFSGINFLKANLSGSNLTQTTFRDANLRYTDFSGCDLTSADMVGADTLLADMTGATLIGAIGLSRDQINDVLTDDETRFPEGL